MILIDEIIVSGNLVRFYEGIDFDKLLKHPKNGSNGFIFCFINNWKSEVTSHNRQKKVSSVIDNEEYEDFSWDKIENNYISIYQTEGMGIFEVYETIRKKVERNQFESQPWVPINSLTTGAWNISNISSIPN
jgi:hypothetical protein